MISIRITINIVTIRITTIIIIIIIIIMILAPTGGSAGAGEALGWAPSESSPAHV